MEKRRMVIFMGILVLLYALCPAQLFAAQDAAVTAGTGGGAKKTGTFRVLDISERTYDNGPAIAVLVSEPLDPTVRHDEHLRISDTRELLKSAWVLSEDGRTLWFPNVDAETEYSVTVLETLKAANGQVLGERKSQSVTTKAITPIISFASEGFLLPAKMNKGLPIVSINVTSVYAEFFRMKPEGLINLVDWDNTAGEKDYYQLAQTGQYGEMVYSGRFDLDVPKNRRTVCHIPVENIEPLQKPGVYLAILREPGQYNYSYQGTYFLVTDIGLHAKAYASESLIFASSLKNGAPLPDVQLKFYDSNSKVVEEGVTDENGQYKTALVLPGDIQIMTASHKDLSGQDQSGVLPMRTPALDMSEFELGKRAYHPREIFMYSPRDLYRPGETATVSALLRDHDAQMIDTIPLTAKLFQPDGREIRTFTWHAQENEAQDMDYFRTELDFPPDAQTGKWELRVWDDPSATNPAAVHELQIEEFLPERMKVDIKIQPDFPGPKDTIKAEVNGMYLYGAPASENEIAFRIRVKAKRDLFENLKDFQFGDVADEEYRDYWETDTKKLDAQGNFTLDVENRWSEMLSPLTVRVVADLYESGGRPVTRYADKTVWPAQNLIGIRPLFTGESADAGPVSFEVVMADTKGKLLPAQGMLVELIKEDRDYYWEYSESTGWLYKFTEKTYNFLADSLNLKGDKATSYTVSLQNGQYVLAIRNPENNVVSSVRFRVGQWWYGEDGGKSARPDKVVLTLNQPTYRPGDLIKLTVTPPHSGEALILVEGDKPLWTKRVPVSGKGTEVEIPILAGWDSHNIYISAIVFRPADAEEKITPNRAVGLIHLPLERSERKIALEIEAPKKTVPEGPLTVKVKMTGDKKETPVYVTLAAVDTGILNITDFKTPDPFGWFFEPRRYDVNAYDMYAKVIENLDGNPAALRYGGDADLAGGKRPESKVKLLSLFHPPVAFDENGIAEITFDLPDFNGKLRIMALAFDANCFGSAEADVTVAAPVVTQLAMPRFLAPGDQSVFTLDVHNLSGKKQDIAIRMKTEGPIALEKEEQNLPLADGEKKTLRFPVRGADNYGTGKVFMELNSGDFQQKRDWQIPVRPGYPGTVRRVFQILKPGEVFSLDSRLADDLIPSTVDGEIKISAQMPLDFQDAMKGLIGYPYGCLEQTSSSAWPLLYATKDQISRYHLTPITPEERTKRLKIAMERLGTMQLDSGAFGLWNRNSPEAAWLTVYVTDFLLTARDMGVEVPAAMLDKALKRLESYVSKSAPLDDYGDNAAREHLDFSVRSYAGYVLSRLNRAPLGTLRTLYDNHRDKAGSSLPLAYMGIALKRMGDLSRSAEALKLAAKKRIAEYGYWGDYSSLIRDLAFTIALFVEYNADSTEGFDTLMQDLDAAMRQRRWLSTQEKSAIFRAGIALQERAEKEWKGKLTVSGKETPLMQKGDYFNGLGAGEISGGVNFVCENPERIYVSAIVRGYTKTPPPKEDAKISVVREIYDIYGKPVDRKEFSVGELVLVHLRISAKQWLPDGLVVDMVPAGFEPENQNLKHSFKMEDMNLDGKSIWKLKEEAVILHEEYRDDRYAAAVQLHDYSPTHLFYMVRVVSPGTFSMPPAFAESMYRPEIRGIGDTPGQITVVNKSR